MEHSIVKPIRSITGREFILPKISEEEFKPYISYDLPDVDYHSRKDCMSSSGCKLILRKSPYYFLQYWCGLIEQEEKDYFNFGRAFHMALLMPKMFRDRYVIRPDFGRSKADQALKNKFFEENSDNVILTEKEHADLIGMLDSTLHHPTARGILSQGIPEVSVFFKDPDTNILCRARPDFIREDEQGVHILDVKTTVDGDKYKFGNDIGKFDYHTQLAFYHDAVQIATGKQVQSVSILAIEKKFPYECFFYVLDDDALEEGRRSYKQALHFYLKSRTMDKWPQAQNKAEMINLPVWFRGGNLPEYDYD